MNEQKSNKCCHLYHQLCSPCWVHQQQTRTFDLYWCLLSGMHALLNFVSESGASKERYFTRIPLQILSRPDSLERRETLGSCLPPLQYEQSMKRLVKGNSKDPQIYSSNKQSLSRNPIDIKTYDKAIINICVIKRQCLVSICSASSRMFSN